MAGIKGRSGRPPEYPEGAMDRHQIFFPDSMIDGVDDIANDRETSRSEVIRVATDEYLRRHRDDA